jgi:drug/metabolite transporter (DMT)-like permease
VPPEIIGAFMALGVGFLFAAGVVMARVGLVNVPSSTGNLISVVSGWVPIAVIAAIFYPNELFTMPAAAYLWMIAVGAINFPIGRFLNLASLKMLGVARANPVMATAPLYSAFVGVVFLDENMTWPIALGILITMGGVILVVTSAMRGSRPQPRPSPAAGAPVPAGDAIETVSILSRFRTPFYLGYASAFTSAVVYGIMPAMSKQAISYSGNPIVTASFTLLAGGLIMALAIAPRIPRDLRMSPRRGLAFVLAGGVSMTIGVLLLYSAVLRAPVIVVSPIVSLQPVIALIMAHFFLQKLERITWPLVLGTLLVVAGVVTITFGIET